MNLTWLKRAGMALAQVNPVVGVVAPIVTALFPKAQKYVGPVEDGLTEAAVVITNAEAFGQVWGKAGQDKLAASVGPISGILLSRLVAGRKIKDPELFKAGATAIADGLAKVLNSIDGDKLEA